jgi:hypothetical protein
VDAIESGLIKIPRTPTDDNTLEAIPKYRNLWEPIRETLPRRGESEEESHPLIDYLAEADGPLKQLAGAWNETFQLWRRELLSPLTRPARGALASQLCAGLGSHDAAVGEGLFTTYGAFLAGERLFRTHPKLPSFLERLVAHDDWPAIQWMAELGEQHRDAFQPKGREQEMTNLATRVMARVEAFGDEPTPDALTRLQALLPKVQS